MNLGQYQRQAAETAVYPDVGRGTSLAVLYLGLGLGEAGEVQGKIKKIIRDDDGVLSDEKREVILDELGDVLWYVAMLARELGVSLETVAAHNLEKLASRAERGTLRGSGDVR